METIALLFVASLGLIIGSFLNCLILRSRWKMSLMGRSFCPSCKRMIAWFDNIPVLSFVFLGGKCRHCRKRISFQYPLVESAAALLFLLVYLAHGGSEGLGVTGSGFLPIARDWFAVSVLIALFVYDLKWYLLPDLITIPAITVISLINFFGFDWKNMLISGIIGGSFFWLQFIISKGKWVGGGDIRLGILMGVFLGWPNIITALFLAYMGGSVVGIGLILAKKKKFGSKIPFGTFLVPATLAAMFWGEAIMKWYLSLFIF